LTPVVANVAQALIALKDAQYYVKRVERLVSGDHAETMDFLAFDLEKAQDELVKLVRLMQNCNHSQ